MHTDLRRGILQQPNLYEAFWLTTSLCQQLSETTINVKTAINPESGSLLYNESNCIMINF